MMASIVSIIQIYMDVTLVMNLWTVMIAREFFGVKNAKTVVIRISSNLVSDVVIVSFVRISHKNNIASGINNSLNLNMKNNFQ